LNRLPHKGLKQTDFNFLAFLTHIAIGFVALWLGHKLCYVCVTGAETPVYAALLPPNAGKPQGEFLKDKMILDWETMSFVSHAVVQPS